MSKGKDLSVFTPAVIADIWKRDRGRCAWCGKPIPPGAERGWGWVIHHRQPRGSGGSPKLAYVGYASNGVLLHARCHDHIERFRAEAFDVGFIVSRIGITRPHEAPIKHAVYGWALLDTEGGYATCEPPQN